jgi:pyridoxamine 5'-phosphate oxidase-like protein
MTAQPAQHSEVRTERTFAATAHSVYGDIPRPDAGALAQELDHPGAQQLLSTAPLARLAYTGPDGFPRVIPVGFLWDGSQIIVCTVPSSPKVRALSARPHVALTIDTDDGPASRALFIRGVAGIDIVDGVPGEYLAAAAKTMDAEQAPQFEANVRALYKQMARITVQPRWARYYDFGAGRLPGFLHKLITDNAAAQS